jgi:hypothetical protein
VLGQTDFLNKKTDVAQPAGLGKHVEARKKNKTKRSGHDKSNNLIVC